MYVRRRVCIAWKEKKEDKRSADRNFRDCEPRRYGDRRSLSTRVEVTSRKIEAIHTPRAEKYGAGYPSSAAELHRASRGAGNAPALGIHRGESTSRRVIERVLDYYFMYVRRADPARRTRDANEPRAVRIRCASVSSRKLTIIHLYVISGARTRGHSRVTGGQIDPGTDTSRRLTAGTRRSLARSFAREEEPQEQDTARDVNRAPIFAMMRDAPRRQSSSSRVPYTRENKAAQSAGEYVRAS